jgi:two-component system clock-associated histidine kinase SasA
LVHSTELVLGTIDDRLDVYQGSYTRLRLHLGNVVLGEAASDAIARLEGETRDKEIRVMVEGASGIPSVQADKRRLQRVFVNLLDNAIKYSPRGGTVRVRFKTRHETDPSIVCLVEDEGPGISAEQVSKLWRPRVGALRDLSERGHGIGLEFCRVVIAAHGGAVWADNREERGTVVGFRLPLTRTLHAD